jgi:2,5-diamino-6-(ribosylamino)-4(3H)-pyrimidinone 5'-phosphate reductase
MNMPYIMVNVAMTIDGKLDSFARKGATISSAEDKLRVDKLRASVDAVLVGGRTLINEDPKLTIQSTRLRSKRLRNGLPENPAKVGIVTNANLKLEGDFMTAGPAVRFLFTTHNSPMDHVQKLETKGATVFVERSYRVDLLAAIKKLHQLGVRKLLVEGGGTIIAELLRLSLVDDLSVYIAPYIFGGSSSPTLTDGTGFYPDQAPKLSLVSMEKYDKDGGVLLHYHIDKSF